MRLCALLCYFLAYLLVFLRIVCGAEAGQWFQQRVQVLVKSLQVHHRHWSVRRGASQPDEREKAEGGGGASGPSDASGASSACDASGGSGEGDGGGGGGGGGAVGGGGGDGGGSAGGSLAGRLLRQYTGPGAPAPLRRLKQRIFGSVSAESARDLMSAMRLQRVQSAEARTSSAPPPAAAAAAAQEQSGTPTLPLPEATPELSEETSQDGESGVPEVMCEGATEIADAKECESEMEATDETDEEKVGGVEMPASGDSKGGIGKKPTSRPRETPSIVLQGTEDIDKEVAREKEQSEPSSSPRSPKLHPLKLRPPSPQAASGSNGSGGNTPARKSPVTVQEWVDSLPIAHSRSEEDIEDHPVEDGEEAIDLGLGAEAGLLYNASTSITVISPQQLRPGVSIDSKLSRRDVLAREPSVQSDVTSHGSHGSSVESYLESRKPDPEEVLLSLGFGGPVSSLDTEVTRIPRRFLQPSKVKGVAIKDFIRHQQELIENFETGFCGYRGLTGPSHSMPSVIVAKIREKLREYERESVHSTGTSEYGGLVSTPSPDFNRRFSHHSHHRHMFKRGSAATTGSSSPTTRQMSSLSVLNADNRRFLENQGSKSPEVPRKRMIIGQQSFTVGRDGDLIEMDLPTSGTENISNFSRPLPPLKPLVHKDSVLSSATDMSLTSVDSDSDTDDKSGSYDLRCLRLSSSPIHVSNIEPLQSSTPYSNNHSKSANTASPSDQESDLSSMGKIPMRPSGIGKRMSSTSLSSWESDTNISPNCASNSNFDNSLGKGKFVSNESDTKDDNKYKVGHPLFSSRLKYESIEEDVEMKIGSDISKELNHQQNSSSDSAKSCEVSSKDDITDLDDSVFVNSESAFAENKVCTVDELSINQGRRGSLKRQQNVAEEEALDILSGSLKPILMDIAVNENFTSQLLCTDHSSSIKPILEINKQENSSHNSEYFINEEISHSFENQRNITELSTTINIDFIENPNSQYKCECSTSTSVQKVTSTKDKTILEEVSDERLEVMMETRGDSFEMEEIGNSEEERGTLSRARSDSSGFLDGDAEKTSDKSENKSPNRRKTYQDEKNSTLLEDNIQANSCKNTDAQLKDGDTGTVVTDKDENNETPDICLLTKRLSLPVVCVLDEKGGVLLRSNSLNSINSDHTNSSGGCSVDLHHNHRKDRRRIQSAPDAFALTSSCSSVSNMFSSCSDESVIHVSLQEQHTSSHIMTSDAAASFRRDKDFQELLEELAGRGVNFSHGFNSSMHSSQPDNQPLPLQADAVRAALGTYSSQLVDGVSSLQSHPELMECGTEAQYELQVVQDIREQIASELRRVASLLEEQPGPRAVAITRQMTVLLREQTRLCQQLEALSKCAVDSPLLNNINTTASVPTVISPTLPCCNSERLLGAVREENRRLEHLVQGHSQELAEIRLLLKELVSKQS